MSSSLLIEVSLSDIQLLLENEMRSKSPVKKELVDLILATNGENYQLVNLYRTLVGIDITPKVSIGDKYWVEQYNLQSWIFDKDAMKKEKLLVENHVLCEIIAINKYKERPVEVSYAYIDGTQKHAVGKSDILVKELKLEHKEIDF